MSDELKMNGPVVTELRVYVINDETGHQGSLNIVLGAGKYHSAQEVKERITYLVAGELEKNAPGFRLMTRPEFMSALMAEMGAPQMKVVGAKGWDAVE